MHIVLGLLTLIGIIAFIVIRVGQVSRAGREVVDAAGEAQSWVRRRSWDKKLEYDSALDISDPRLAATMMMCALAKEAGDLTERQKGEIRASMQSYFQLTDGDAEEMLAEAHWRTSKIKVLSSYLLRLAPAIQEVCGDQEKRDLIAMLRSVAKVQGGSTEIQDDAIRQLQRQFGLLH